MTQKAETTETLKNELDVDELAQQALLIRRDVIKMLGIAGSGHPGGSLSITDILAYLYFYSLKHRPKDPRWEGRDRIIFSKGHACPALYAALARSGYFEVEKLLTLRQLESPLQGHPDRRRLPGIEASTGSLGQGLSIGIGCALAARFDKKDFRTYVVMSDGELNEGQTWEAASFAAFHKLDHLVLVLDMNRYQLSGSTKDILDMEPVVDKLESFGWRVKDIDGHTFNEIHEAFTWAQQAKGKPSVIVARTVKGKGVSFMENNNHFHGVAPTKEETERALKELGEKDAEIKRITGMIGA